MNVSGDAGDSQYSVYQFFMDGSYERVRSWVSAEEAVTAAKHYMNSVGAKLGTTVRVIVTDGGDCTNFEWQFGKGIIYPPEATKYKDEGGLKNG